MIQVFKFLDVSGSGLGWKRFLDENGFNLKPETWNLKPETWKPKIENRNVPEEI